VRLELRFGQNAADGAVADLDPLGVLTERDPKLGSGTNA
jgi:hypothetical protein